MGQITLAEHDERQWMERWIWRTRKQWWRSFIVGSE